MASTSPADDMAANCPVVGQTIARTKNKRKMSAPRKRTDVTVKRISLEDGSSDLYDDDDDDDDDGGGGGGGDDVDGDDEADDNDVAAASRALRLTSVATPGGESPSSGSDDRNNSSGSGYSPAPVVIPTVPAQLLQAMGGGLGALALPKIAGTLPAPYGLLPGLPQALRTGFYPPIPPPTVAPPGLVPPDTPSSTSSSSSSPGGAVVTSSDRFGKSPQAAVDSNHNRVGAERRPSPSGSQRSEPPSPCTSVGSGPGDGRPASGSAAAAAAAASRKQRKNYKNMTRERRVEANARERTRVHTISAAFESLRRAVPSYSYHQRLSKLAILRIACSYILALSRLADLDYDDDDRQRLSFSECVDLCTQTIQSEGRAKRRH